MKILNLLNLFGFTRHSPLKVIDETFYFRILSRLFITGIDKDLISTVHGTPKFVKQLIRQHILYRDAIVLHKADYYPMILFQFNEELLNRKQSNIHYKNSYDDCLLPNPVSAEMYDTSENRIAKHVRSFFKENSIFYHSLKISIS
jgi:hypothetical protein